MLYSFCNNLHRPSNLFWYTPTFQSCKSFQLCQSYSTNVFFKLSGIVSIITFNWLQFISCYKNKCGFRHLKCNISVIKPVPDYFVKIGLLKICTRNWYWTKCDRVKTESKQISMMFLLRERGFKNTIWLISPVHCRVIGRSDCRVKLCMVVLLALGHIMHVFLQLHPILCKTMFHIYLGSLTKELSNSLVWRSKIDCRFVTVFFLFTLIVFSLLLLTKIKSPPSSHLSVPYF